MNACEFIFYLILYILSFMYLKHLYENDIYTYYLLDAMI